MSHYTVVVVVRAANEEEAEAAVDEALEPFSEHFEVSPYEEDVLPEEVERALTYVDEQRQRRGEGPVSRGDLAAVLATVSDWVGREVRRRADGSLFYESTWNPDGHWDWWVIGGRWADGFQLKDGNRGDLVRVTDLDSVSMQQAAEKAAHAAFDEYEQAVGGLPVGPRWAATIEQHGREHLDQARREFAADPWVQAASKGVWFEDPHDFWCVDAEDPRAAFVARQVGEVGVPYAWLQDGCWEQQGYIGMFMAATPTDVDKAVQWREQVAAKWAALDENLWVANVDCHT